MSKCGGDKDKGKMSSQQRQAISAGMTGKKKSAAQKKAISEGMKNSPCKRKKSK